MDNQNKFKINYYVYGWEWGNDGDLKVLRSPGKD